MRCRSPGALLLAALVFSLSAGCSSRPTTKKNPPPDPLLLSKTPLQAKYGQSSEAQARPQVDPPTIPAGAWVVAPTPAAPAARLGKPDEPGPFRMTAEKRPVPATANEGPAWLQGVLERTADEKWLLRCEAGTPQPAGGKVLLEGHPLLDMFFPGYVIRVEGRLIEGATPRYQVEHVRLLQRGTE